MDRYSYVLHCCNELMQETLFADPIDNSFQADSLFEEINQYLRKRYHYNIIRWNNECEFFPKHMLLGGDKGILAYIVYRYFEGDIFEESDLRFELNGLLATLRCAQSKLDRPIFFVNLLNYSDLSGLYFETNEEMMDRIYMDDKSIDDTFTYYYPSMTTMGDFSNFTEIVDELKCQGVRQY